VKMNSKVTFQMLLPSGEHKSKSTVQDIINRVASSTKINKNCLVLYHHDILLDSTQLFVDTSIKRGDVVTVKKIKSKSSPHTFPGYCIKVVNHMPRVSAQTRSGAKGPLETLLAVESNWYLQQLKDKVEVKWNITAPCALFVNDTRIVDYTKTLEDAGVGDGAKVDVKMTGLVGGGTGSDWIKESKEETRDCVLCGGLYEMYGNNPRPLANDGRCCDSCNWNKVVPYRFYQAVLQHRAQQQENEMDEESTVGVEESKEEED